MAKDSIPPATRSGDTSSGSDFGAKISDVKRGVVTLDPATPKTPETPVRH